MILGKREGGERESWKKERERESDEVTVISSGVIKRNSDERP